MEKIFFIFLTICSITSLPIHCQNNLDQATKSILENAQSLKEKLSQFTSEQNYVHSSLTIEQLQAILIMEASIKNSRIIENINTRKNAYEKLDAIAKFFEETKTTDHWMNYFAIHNQMIIAVQNELEALQICPKLCQEINQRIINALDQAIQNLYEKNGKPKEMISLIYIQDDYIQLFKKYS